MASVVSVNVGLPRPVAFTTTSLPQTSIEKHAVAGPVRITAYGVEGNASADTAHHGDEFMRVYAYAVEDYRWWETELGRPLRPGQFGEQLTTEGIDVNAALVGETWRVGTAVLQIAHVRIPCRTFQGWMGHTGHDPAGWVRRFAAAARPGPYFRVLEEGTVAAGDAVVVLNRPDHEVTVATLFRALLTDPHLLPQLVAVDGLKDSVRARALASLAPAGSPEIRVQWPISAPVI